MFLILISYFNKCYFVLGTLFIFTVYKGILKVWFPDLKKMDIYTV